MLKRLFARDRFVLSGLVITGLLMVAAGVVSGRSTFNYVLGLDARSAAQSWVREAESRARADAGTLQSDTEAAKDSAASFGDKLFAEIDRLFGANAESGAKNADDHISRVNGVAVFDRDQELLSVSGTAKRQLESLRTGPGFAKAFEAAVHSGRPQLLDAGVGPEKSAYDHLVLVPTTERGKVARVYVVEANQRSAEAVTRSALMAVSLTTGLLIVMGFVVPAAIASRRIRERWAAEDQMRFLALHDSLTGLPNRVQMKDRLDRAVARAKRHQRPMAVLCLDLDRFKTINDTLGHATGDGLLEEVSHRLLHTVRETDVVARLGGDEFAIIAEDLDSPDDATALARRLCEAIATPFDVNGHEFANSVSIGIALGPVEGAGGDTLLKNADLALYRAKHDGRNTFRFFEPEMDAALQERRRMENDLRLAIRNGDLEVRYQPQYELNSGRITGYEALLRWHHPTRGDVPPSVFLPIAEETGLIAPIGEWVLRTACAYAATWPEHIRLAVNLSPAQFRSQDVVTIVARILEETGLDPRRLELEITERLLLQNTEAVIATLKRLDALGVSIAMDDFGTGYSSLSYLTKFPVRKIKIDRSFIDRLGTTPETTAIVNSIVGLGQSLNVTITAEGVENAGQADMLRSWGCDQVQGFFYGQAEPAVTDDSQQAEEASRLAS